MNETEQTIKRVIDEITRTHIRMYPTDSQFLERLFLMERIIVAKTAEQKD